MSGVINLCKSCLHKEVCMFKNDYDRLVEALSDQLNDPTVPKIFTFRMICIKRDEDPRHTNHPGSW